METTANENKIVQVISIAIQAGRTIEFIYYSYEDGHKYASCPCVTPVSLTYKDHWALRGKDGNNVEHEYDVRNIQSVDSLEVRGMKERIRRAFENALSNMGLLNDVIV
jgi:hypothetical protein